jgi:voltage-gated potassium channel
VIRYVMRAVWKLLVLFPAVFLVAAVLFWYFERDREGGLTFADALYYGVVTLSTVGYGDIYPETTGGRWVAVGLIVFALTALGYFLTKISDAVMEARRMEQLGMQGTSFENHLVVIGWNQIARVALRELMASKRQVAVVTEEAHELPEIREYGGKDQLFATVGNISSDAVLERAGILRASTVIVASDDDSQNLVLSLNVRASNPRARIICAVKREELRRTLTASGVTYVTNPFEFSGRMVASAAFEPEVAHFVEDITSGATGAADVQQFSLSEEFGAKGHSVAELQSMFHERGGALLVAVGIAKDDNWEMIPNPPRDTRLKANDVVVVLGSPEQSDNVGDLLGSIQGR